MRRFLIFLAVILFFNPAFSSAHEASFRHWHVPINVVSTTGIINDIVKSVGGDKISAKSLMGPGVDPHVYRATAGDMGTLASADLIFHHGLHLEGKISDVISGMKSRDIQTVAVTDDIPRPMLIPVGGDGNYDPHVWFDPALWTYAVRAVEQSLSEIDPVNADYYRKNARAYIAELSELDEYARIMSSGIPEEGKFLVTSHDAFLYFGKAYGFKVRALQGVSTVSEASISDVDRVVELIVRKKIPAIFTESSVSPRYIKSVKEAVEASGESVRIGGELYSDALGSEESGHGNFPGMFKHNVEVIFLSLSNGDERELATVNENGPGPEQYLR